MSRPVLRVVQAGFGGGLNTTADDLAMQPNEARLLENARVDEYGNASKRPGTVRLHAAPLTGVVRGGMEWNGQQYVSAGGTLSKGVLATTIAWATVGAGLSPTNPTRFVPFQRPGGQVLYIADGGRLAYTDGTTVTRLGTGPTSVSTVWVYNQRLFTVQGDFVYWSGLNNGDTLGVAPTGGFAPVRTFTDGALTVGAPLKGSALLFHRTGISRFTGIGQDDINIQAGMTGVTGDVGTTAPGSVVPLEDICLFLSDRGFYLATETNVQPISAPIERTLEGLDRQLWPSVLGVHNRRQREVWFLLPGLGLYVYQYRLGRWFGPWTGTYTSAPPTALWEATGTDGRPVVLAGDGAGWVKLTDAPGVATDDAQAGGTGGTSVLMRVRTGRLFGNDVGLDKSFRTTRIVCSPRTASGLSVTLTTRSGQDTQQVPTQARTWGTGTWGSGVWGGESLRTRTLKQGGRGEYAEYEVTCDCTVGTPTIARIEGEAYAMGYRGMT